MTKVMKYQTSLMEDGNLKNTVLREPMPTYEGTSSNIRNNDDDRNAPKATNQRATYSDT